MRNLKRVLSLALAVVMVIGMMVMTTSAADLTDYDEITNVEAVDVMVALGVLEGYDDGSFKPETILTREQAAKIICYMLMGPKNADKLSKNTNIFVDVAAGRWSAGYIAYCYNLGIIAGNGDGTFDPEGELTGVAFGKMLLVALGYDPAIEGYVGANWATEIATDMIAAGIDAEGPALDDALSRDNAAAMAFYTLMANMVAYNTKTEVETGNATVTVSGGRNDVVRTGTDFRGVTEAGNDGYQQFCEKYFPNLKMVATTDGMERYAHEWMIKRDSIGVYTEAPDYTAYVNWKNSNLTKVVDDISKKFKDSNADIFVNGLAQADYEAIYNGGVAYTGNRGDLVEIYMDVDDVNLVDRIVLTHTTVARLNGNVVLTETQNATYIDIPNVVTAGLTTYVHGYEDLQRGDVVMYYTDNENHTWIQIVEPFTGTMTATTKTDKVGSSNTPATYTVDGKVYRHSGQTNGYVNAQLINFEGVADVSYYLDNAGHIIYAVGALAPTELMLILKNYDYTAGGSVFEADKEKSQVLFVNKDGSVEIVKIASIDGDRNMGANTAINNTYSLDDDVSPWTANVDFNTAGLFSYKNTVKGYELNAVTYSIATDVEIVSGLPTYHDALYKDDQWITNSETVYLVRDYSTQKSAYVDSFTAYVGYEAVPSIDDAHCIVYKGFDGIADYVVVTEYAAIANTGNDLFYAISNNVTAVYKAGTNNRDIEYYYITGVANGEIVNLKLNAFAAAAVGTNFTNELFNITKYDADGYVDTIVKLADATKYWVKMTGTEAAKADILVMNTAGTDKAFSYSDNTVVYTVNPLGNALSVGTVEDIATDDNDLVTVVTKGGLRNDASSREAVEIYIQKKNPTAPTKTLTLTGDNNFAYIVNADAAVYAASGVKAVSATDVVTISGYTASGTTYTVTGVTVASGNCNLINNGDGTWTVKNVTSNTALNITVVTSAVPNVTVAPATYTVTLTGNTATPAATIAEIIDQLMDAGYARSEITVAYSSGSYTVSTTQNGVAIGWTVTP